MLTKWDFLDARILVVDDHEANLVVARELLHLAGYRSVEVVQDPCNVIEGLLAETPPDIVLLDLHMPRVTGYDILAAVKERMPTDTYVPILVLTADSTPMAREQALALGASDFITKPFERTELILRVRNFLRMRYMHLDLLGQNADLEARVRARTAEMERARAEALSCLARAMEYRDDATGGHTRRVGAISGFIAAALGLEEETVELIRLSAPLHDLGKIGISDTLLLKPSRYTDEEFEMMKQHTLLGETIVGECESPLLGQVKEIALHHHERWDGSGYPHGLRGEDIPIACRIVATADMFDALISARPYKPAWPLEQAVEEIRRLSGSHLDPDVVEAFLRPDVQRKIRAMSEETGVGKA